MRLRQELVRLISGQASKARDAAQAAAYLSTMYDSLLQTLSVRPPFLNRLDAINFLCSGWPSTNNTCKGPNGDSVLAGKRRGGQKAPRFDSRLICQRLDVC